MPILRVSARIGLITSVLLIAAPLKVAAQELTLAETARLALEHAPWYAHHRANVDAAAEPARPSLARWIPEHARDPLPAALPALPAPPPSFDAARHPETRAAQAELEAMQAEVDMARAEYRPGVMLDLNYRPPPPMPDRAPRPNTATVMGTLDLPIFRSKRQDRRLAESQNKEAGARLETEDRRRELEAMYG